MQAISGSVGDSPLLEDLEAGGGEQISAKQLAHRPAVLADGSYATQTALADVNHVTSTANGASPNIRCPALPLTPLQVFYCTTLPHHHGLLTAHKVEVDLFIREGSKLCMTTFGYSDVLHHAGH